MRFQEKFFFLPSKFFFSCALIHVFTNHGLKIVVTVEKLNLQKPSNTLMYSLPANTTPVKNSDSQENKGSNKNYTKKYILPASLVTAGTILLYLGLKKTCKDPIFNNVIDQKLDSMKGYLKDFKGFVDNTLSKSFKGADKYTDTYKKNYSYNAEENIKGIRISNSPADVLTNTKTALSCIAQTYSTEHHRQGTSVFDKFIVALNKEANSIRGTLWNERLKNRANCEDLIHFIFKDYNNLHNISNARGKLIARKYLTDLDMESYQEKSLQKVINEKTKDLAEAIRNSETNYAKSKQEIIDAAFERISTLMNLGSNFKPVHGKTFTLENFEKLTPKELQPQTMPEKLVNLFKGNAVWNSVVTKDFSKISTQEIENIFSSLSAENSVADIGLMIDTLRLENAVNKIDNSLLNNTIAKLEFLSAKLTRTGEEKLMNLCKKDYLGYNKEKIKAELHYVKDVSKKLGFPTVESMENYYLKTTRNFLFAPIRDYIPLLKEKPEVYFS